MNNNINNTFHNNFTTCSICFEKYFYGVDKPVFMVPCNHVICVTCYRSIYDVQKPDIKCPKCMGRVKSLRYLKDSVQDPELQFAPPEERDAALDLQNAALNVLFTLNYEVIRTFLEKYPTTNTNLVITFQDCQKKLTQHNPKLKASIFTDGYDFKPDDSLLKFVNAAKHQYIYGTDMYKLYGTTLSPFTYISPLTISIIYRNNELVRTLLDYGADPNLSIFGCSSALEFIIGASHIKYYDFGKNPERLQTKIDHIKYAVNDCGINVNKRCPNGLTPFILAVYLNNPIEILKLLIELGVNLRNQVFTSDFYGLMRIGTLPEIITYDKHTLIGGYLEKDGTRAHIKKDTTVEEFATLINSPRLKFIKQIYSTVDRIYPADVDVDKLVELNKKVLDVYKSECNDDSCTIMGGGRKNKKNKKSKKVGKKGKKGRKSNRGKKIKKEIKTKKKN